jgi:hypothetical protein
MAQRMLEISPFYRSEQNEADHFIQQILCDRDPNVNETKMQQIYASLCFFKVKQETLNLINGEDICEVSREGCDVDEKNNDEELMNDTNTHTSSDILAQAMRVLDGVEHMDDSIQVHSFYNIFITNLLKITRSKLNLPEISNIFTNTKV